MRCMGSVLAEGAGRVKVRGVTGDSVILRSAEESSWRDPE
jgi:hypothetical protein